ncbi:MAG TPA: Gfo/Idh/MocA family oxidoreductase [Tepidisphaeraceae bacterium]
MDKVRLGVIGLGNMGSSHLGYLPNVSDAVVTAVCDIEEDKAQKFAKLHNAAAFTSADELLKAKVADAVIVATPHYDHPPIGIRALETGHHVLVEKPIAVSVKAARQLVEAARQHPNLKFGIMFNQRSNPVYQQLRSLIADGELGELTRVTWLITDWFRTWTYYASGGWRATWAGEGGGVLINQCPHNLDLMQWITGLMPTRVTAVGFIGKSHPIEVEDEMSAILEYPNGAIGHFVTSTGEAPGTNRLEICGERGKVVCENGKLTFSRMRQNVREVRETSPLAFAHPERWTVEIPVGKAAPGGEHERVMRNFLSAIVRGTPMLAPGEEGIRGLEISNAMHMSAFLHKSVELPIDGDAFDALIKDLTTKYAGRKTLETKSVVADMAASSSSF